MAFPKICSEVSRHDSSKPRRTLADGARLCQIEHNYAEEKLDD